MVVSACFPSHIGIHCEFVVGDFLLVLSVAACVPAQCSVLLCVFQLSVAVCVPAQCCCVCAACELPEIGMDSLVKAKYPSLKESLFVYIGLTCIFERLIVPLEIVGENISLDSAATFLPAAFIDLIKKEWTVIKDVFDLSKRKDRSEFVRVDHNLFIYCFPQHTRMSSVSMTRINTCGSVKVTVKDDWLRPCDMLMHLEHDGLEPFFSANPLLLHKYNEILASTSVSVQRKSEVQTYKCRLASMMESGQHQNSCYHCNGLPNTTGWALTEDEWTTRLYYCLSM